MAQDRKLAKPTQVPETPRFIKVPLGSGGCYLLLSVPEYERGLKRGKAMRRAEALKARADQARGRAEAALLPKDI